MKNVDYRFAYVIRLFEEDKTAIISTCHTNILLIIMLIIPATKNGNLINFS